jgi:hypothetical protein
VHLQVGNSSTQKDSSTVTHLRERPRPEGTMLKTETDERRSRRDVNTADRSPPLRGARMTSLSPVVDDQLAHVQTAHSKLVDFDDAEAGAPDRQVPDDQAADGRCSDRDSSDRQRSDGQAAEPLRADRLGADRARRFAGRGLSFRLSVHRALVHYLRRPGPGMMRLDARESLSAA